jgi:choline dehydrogenase-like flavoprotein
MGEPFDCLVLGGGTAGCVLTIRAYFPPVGTCAMGAAGDERAVVDGRGCVHGVANLHVADASVMPTIPRANTNLTTAAIAERLAESIAGGV